MRAAAVASRDGGDAVEHQGAHRRSQRRRAAPRRAIVRSRKRRTSIAMSARNVRAR